MEERLKPVFDYLSGQCARREYCSKDILAKAMNRLDGDEDAARRVLERLESEGYVSDARYALAFARDKSSLAGWGPHKIRQGLYAKGMSRELADAALSEIDSERAAEVLDHLLLNKWRSLKDDPQGKLKLIRFALSRGYEYDCVKDAVERLLS